VGLALGLASGCAYSDPGDGDQQFSVDLSLGYAPHVGDTTTLTGNVRLPAAPDGQGGEADLDDFNKLGLLDTAAAPTLTLLDTDTQESFVTTQGTADFAGYHRHLSIRIEGPSGSLSCKLEGPGRHTLLSPLQGQLIHLGDDLTVRWKTTDGMAAHEVDVHLSLAGYSLSLREDSGACLIPAKLLRAGNETITVTRRNRLLPAGAAAPSEIRMHYALAVTFQVL
jgi:hypothetical protein